MKIDWTRKLTSRKLWMSVASFVSMMIMAFGYSESAAAQVSAIIMAGATVIGYVIGEGLSDSGYIDVNAEDAIQPIDVKLMTGQGEEEK